VAKTKTILPYDVVSSSGGVLNININKEFDSGNLHQDWAQSILTLHPGPYKCIRIDLCRCGSVSSTFFAGLVALHAMNTDGQRLILVDPDPRVLRNLRMLQLAQFYQIEWRLRSESKRYERGETPSPSASASSQPPPPQNPA